MKNPKIKFQTKTRTEILKRIISVFETDYIPVPKYKGPLYLSRYGLYVDPKVDPKGYHQIEYIQILMDGNRSCFDIAHSIGADFFFVRNFCDRLSQYSLLEREERNLFLA